MRLDWKENWPESRENFKKWWNHSGFVISHWGTGLPMEKSLYGLPEVPEAKDPVQRHTDPGWVLPAEEYRLSCNWQGADFLPIGFPDYGTVTLATYLGVEALFEEEYINYKGPGLSSENDWALKLDKGNKYYKEMFNMTLKMRDRSAGRYAIGYPAFMPGLDVLAELRGTQDLLMDLVLEPDWVKAKLAEINEAYFECYEDYYQALKGEDGSSVTGYFMLWGEGRTSMAQCDFCSMISPEMFEEFEGPVLTEHCDRMDNTMYHLDGPDALNKLDYLLSIPSLDAIQWTPGPKLPQGGDASWYDMYKKIKAAGKSVQSPWVKSEEVLPLINEVGPEGMYIMVDFKTRDEVETVLKQVEQFR